MRNTVSYFMDAMMKIYQKGFELLTDVTFNLGTQCNYKKMSI